MFDIPIPPPPRHNLPVSRAPSTPARAQHSPAGDPRGARRPRPTWQPRTPAEQWWHYSRGCAAALRAGRPPTAIQVYGPVLEPGEQALLSAEIDYSRLCGADGRYSPLPLIVAGRPAVMFGALAVQGLVNHRRKIAAAQRAATQWRWHQRCPVIVTTDRLICTTAEHGMLSFWFGTCTEFYPDLQQWTLTLGFDSTYPVRLSGPAAPALSLWSAYGVLGESWVDDPRLAALLS
ncbi:hypothetical protein [Mycobacterium avium]|jgi:hypothetical protein|uniref:Uncharacterized protein n=1 Tax=Mycobacterium avium subsp. hominissuis TaxID=439334 RepID=A0A187NDV8_MYCAV|nr:hypothetical protein [Mycobacterium avium]AKT73079.1 hypothetical protein MASH_00101 [Mycobacterium avium subsp. hominissuis]MBZ4522157.1 hypothetical protein [Mycobacterium avium subsp. hominissuis]MBZ4526662.1 hypothetical protein [Mycobacterium avium subsp. hominissuis]MBZ4532374.1 hypothetical protein [Mycobacterium avium subsp. hominissuis]MBZ4557894.1 hypothetical protein [Mycobacterium avium subsp. hominissuis]